MGRLKKTMRLGFIAIFVIGLVLTSQINVLADTTTSRATTTKIEKDAATLASSTDGAMSRANSATSASKVSTTKNSSATSSTKVSRRSLAKVASSTASGKIGTVIWTITDGTLHLSGGNFGTGLTPSTATSPWAAYNVTTVEIDGTITADSGANYSYLFANMGQVTKFVNMDRMDFANVTDVTYMFSHDEKLQELDLSQANFGQVTSMIGMFFYCFKLTNLDVSHWDVSHVTKMQQMFWYTTDLKKIDVSHWNISQVQSFNFMFAYAGITYLDLSNWQMSSSATRVSMFGYTTTLNHLKLGQGSIIKDTGLKEPSVAGVQWLQAGTTTKYTSASLMAKYDGTAEAGNYYLSSMSVVAVNYVNEDGTKIAESPELMVGTEGESYTTTAPTVSGYTLQNKPTNATGTYTTGTTTVTYVYTGDLFFKSVPTSIDFGQHIITAGTATYPVTQHTGDLTIQNNGKLQSYWQLSAQLAAAGFVGNDKGATLAATLSYQSSNGQLVTLQPGTPAIIETQQTASHEPITLSDNWTNAETGLQLKVPTGAARQDSYQATLTWTLTKTVANN